LNENQAKRIRLGCHPFNFSHIFTTNEQYAGQKQKAKSSDTSPKY